MAGPAPFSRNVYATAISLMLTRSRYTRYFHILPFNSVLLQAFFANSADFLGTLSKVPAAALCPLLASLSLVRG